MSHLSHIGKKYFKLIEFDENEELLLEIRKHTFGLFVLVLSGVLIAATIMLATFALAASNFVEEVGLDGARGAIALAGFILAVLTIVLTAIFAQLYRNNVVFVTNEKIAQILYINLFNKKISQLNIGDVQDVTFTQRGILAHLFHYGTLVIETAGEQQNYTFTYVPKPQETAKVLISAHESNLKQYGN